MQHRSFLWEDLYIKGAWTDQSSAGVGHGHGVGGWVGGLLHIEGHEAYDTDGVRYRMTKWHS